MAQIKIRLPEKLPSEGLTPVKFKAWKGQLIIYLKQSVDYRRFLPGGLYANWSANDEVEDRIENLHANDHPEQRLADCQTQLETFLSIIAGLCDQPVLNGYGISLNLTMTSKRKVDTS